MAQASQKPADDDYASTLEHFDTHSNHTEAVVDVLKAGLDLQRQCLSGSRLLDVGAGTGSIARLLTPYFDGMVLLEPKADEYKLQACKSKSAASCEVVQARFMDWAASNSGPAPFDLVLCSQMLYYVPLGQWPAYLTKMLGMLRRSHDPGAAPDGHLAVVMVANKGPLHDLRARINPDYSNSDHVRQVLYGLPVTSIRTYRITSTLKTTDVRQFRAIIELFIGRKWAKTIGPSDEATAALDQTITGLVHSHKLPALPDAAGGHDVYQLVSYDDVILVR